MNKRALEEHCLQLNGATHDFKEEWNAHRYLIGEKMFAMIGTEASGKPIISLKCDPSRAEVLRESYYGIIPGYYLNKTHWNSIYLDAELPESLWEKLIIHSYELVFQKLPKKLREEILSKQSLIEDK